MPTTVSPASASRPATSSPPEAQPDHDHVHGFRHALNPRTCRHPPSLQSGNAYRPPARDPTADRDSSTDRRP